MDYVFGRTVFNLMKSWKSTVCSKLYAKSYSSSSCRNTIVNKSTKVNHCDVMMKNASLQVMIDDKDCIHFSGSRLAFGNWV